MPEGLSVSEVGKEIAEHQHGNHAESDDHSSRGLTIVEAILLAVVAVIAAYSGFASSKWGTESSLKLAKAATVRNFASRTQLQGLETKNFDSSTFNVWFTAYVDGNTTAMTVAEHRFRPNFWWHSMPGLPPTRSPISRRRRARPTCPSTSSRSCRRPIISTRKPTTSTTKVLLMGRMQMTTSERLSFWPQFFSWSESRGTFVSEQLALA